ncbi:hypothetical protein TUM20985_56670 [Mycobacterium antarcticum]|uniref:hypothetical protein n=1 Tax=Mycolicibacterium sp. TUM20985 TaxID=3023370 RepID=UPI0025742D5F|nr:hypothetical protein [Mycolicibacterium sp. TUM20985]BDX35120.1 hypothetical protein TUM20985_56670 [Mycolicibacterium sp. TUM20985]
MTTDDRRLEDVPTLREVGPKAAATDRYVVDTPPVNRDDFGDGRADPDASHTAQHADMPDAARSETDSTRDGSLFADDELAGLRARWDTVQAGFVDDPRDCVQKADGLVADVVTQLTSGFTDARSRLEQQWSRGEEASTEDLRLALKRYRGFLDRLLAV